MQRTSEFCDHFQEGLMLHPLAFVVSQTTQACITTDGVASSGLALNMYPASW